MNKEHLSLTYFISRPFFFGIIYSQLFNLSGNDSLISCVIGTLLGFIILYLISKMNFDNHQTIQLLFYLFLLILALCSIETYVSSFLLVKTPKIIIIIPAIMLVSYVSFKDTNSLKKCAFIFFIISTFSLLIVSLLLSSYLNISNVLPFFTTESLGILKGSVIFAIMSCVPNILLKEENMPLKKQIIYYLMVSLINTLICFLTLAALTPNVAKIYSYPEYMVLKRIKLLSFIENVENISVLIWYFDFFFLLVFIFKRLFNLIKKRVVFGIIIALTTLLTTFYIANNYYLTIWLYTYCPLIMLVFFLLFLTTISSEKHK